MNHLKMLQLFLSNENQFGDDIGIFRKHRDKGNGIGSRFLLAPSVIGEDFFQITFGDICPSWIGKEFQFKHAKKFG